MSVANTMHDELRFTMSLRKSILLHNTLANDFLIIVRELRS